MNTRLSTSRVLCVPLVAILLLSACGYKGPLYMPPNDISPKAAEPTYAPTPTLDVAVPAAQNATNNPTPIQKKVVN